MFPVRRGHCSVNGRHGPRSKTEGDQLGPLLSWTAVCGPPNAAVRCMSTPATSSLPFFRSNIGNDTHWLVHNQLRDAGSSEGRQQLAKGADILVSPDDAGGRGENLESVQPLPWPGIEKVNLEYVKGLATRLLAATYRPPDLLNLFALRKAHLLKILLHAKERFSKEQNIVDVIVPYSGTVRVFGDTHGDFHSLMEAINNAGLPSTDNIFVFAGDCVDRGCWGVEVVALILALKLCDPSNVILVRGNHETTGCTKRYGFESEVHRKYDSKTFDLFCKTFRELPVAAVLRSLPATTSAFQTAVQPATRKQRRKSSRGKRTESPLVDVAPTGQGWRAYPLLGEKRVLVVHGGLFRAWKSQRRCIMTIGDLVDLAEVSRRDDDPYECLLEDVIWSDPSGNNEVSCNTLRGAGILYGTGAVQSFFKRNGLSGMIRAHEGPDVRERRADMKRIDEGYSIDMELAEGFVATVFTAADYPGLPYRGAVILLAGAKRAVGHTTN
ncbi:Serine/threonine phosphatase [Gracilaria domingensis]|nr:Serine/threonine phosphatase [Gracilaria domingensis]